MDGMSREEALEVVGDVPDLCSALVGKGECLKGAKGRDTTVNGWSNQRNFTNYNHWRNSSLSGEIPRAAIQGILLPSPVEALVPLWISLQAAEGPGAQSTWAGWQVPRYFTQLVSTAGASWQRHGEWII